MDNLEKIYNEVAIEMGLSKNRIRSIAESQFSFIGKTIRDKNLDSIRLQFLGMFKVKPGRLRGLSPEAKEIIKQRSIKKNESN